MENLLDLGVLPRLFLIGGLAWDREGKALCQPSAQPWAPRLGERPVVLGKKGWTV